MFVLMPFTDGSSNMLPLLLLLHGLIFLTSSVHLVDASTWSEWWTYEGISGPDFWGRVNPEWVLCSKGKKQSPIDIKPRDLLFDPSLKHIHMDKHKIGGTLINSGQDIKLIIDEPNQHYVNISGGPLSYKYRVSEIIIHFGSIDSLGSEHTIDGESFPGEVQIIAYNTDIYGNMTQAVYSSHGIAILALLIKVAPMDKQPNPVFEVLTQNLPSVKYKGKQTRIRHFSVHGLLPETTDFVTYEGSLTQPGCQETATWIIMNNPMYVSREHMMLLRDLMRGDESNPLVSLTNNCRPTMQTHQRSVRTNINVGSPTKGCTFEKNMQYQANSLWNERS